MKAIELVVEGLRCDAPGCGYTQNYPRGSSVDFEAWLNAPCPKCGANLCTEADLRVLRGIRRFTRILNRLLWPLTLFSRKQKAVTFDLGMDGTGKINPKIVDK
jgi:hypothetical protein